MFGKPQWFRRKKVGWGLRPVTVQGWLYTAAWSAVLALPFATLVLRNQPAEALIWLAAACVLLVYDVRQIMAVMTPSQPAEDVLYIGDDEASNERLATRNYDFRLRR